MSDHTHLYAIITACENAGDTLSLLVPTHELLLFNCDGVSEEDRNRITDIFMSRFLPEVPLGDPFTEEQQLLMFRRYLDHLRAAIFVHKITQAY